ncbi:MAG: hypothetical protein LBH19_06335 [Dysgonamonadaceae bacterium]|jgi:hypothetical protein|nr:hypothetical protein [Dysgonamonadaceae bacterium]
MTKKVFCRAKCTGTAVVILAAVLLVSCGKAKLDIVEVGMNSLTFSMEAHVTHSTDMTQEKSFTGSVSLPEDITDFSDNYSKYIRSVLEVKVSSVKVKAEEEIGVTDTQIQFDSLQKGWTIGQYRFGEEDYTCDDEALAVFEDVLKEVFAGKSVPVTMNGKTDAATGSRITLTFTIDGLFTTSFWQ